MKKLKSLWLLLIVPVLAGILIEWFAKIDVLGAIWKGLGWLGHLFVIEVTVRAWGVVLLILAPVAVLVLLRRHKDRSYLGYTSDSFLGVSWRWAYLQGRRPSDIIPICPACQMQLTPDRHAEFPAIYWCQRCGAKHVFDDYTAPRLHDRVEKEIDRKIRTGEYKGVLRRRSNGDKTGSR